MIDKLEDTPQPTNEVTPTNNPTTLTTNVTIGATTNNANQENHEVKRYKSYLNICKEKWLF
eukprot:1559466-Ditylum_brightwellii.AAC.1